MPTRLDTNFARLSNSDEFESMIRDICAFEWQDPYTEKNGRSGQKQFGVDIYGRPIGADGKYRAAQCKLRTTDKQLSQQEIEVEVKEARKFPHDLDTLIIVTDLPRDTHTQITVNQISQAEIRLNGRRVVIWFWDDVIERLAAYPRLIVKYYRDYFAALTALPIVERLIDTPLQILSVKQSSFGELTLLERSLQFRGLRILKQEHPRVILVNTSLNDVSPDGIVAHYNTSNDPGQVALQKFAGNLLVSMQRVDQFCPIFAILPPTLVDQFVQSMELLGADPHRIRILSDNQSASETVNYILQAVFDYGYTRRGGLATVDVTVRTGDGRPASALLDIDWQSALSMSQFPTPEEWQRTFVPAITDVRKLLLNRRDKIKIQFNCNLFLPAAFGLGFHFNIRLAKIGVWTRRPNVNDFKQQFWLSDGSMSDVVYKPEWIRQTDGCSRSAIVELTTYTSIHQSVVRYVEKLDLSADEWVEVHLKVDGKYIANLDESHAIAYASQIGRLIRHLNERGVTDTHLFARIPSPLAVLIGQRLLACGRIHLYWFDDPTYRFAFTLI